MNKRSVLRTVLALASSLPKRHQVAGAEEARPPVFVLGSGRNGSTLLNRMLNGHSGLFLPTEQYFLGPTIFRYYFYNWLPWDRLAERMLLKINVDPKSHTWESCTFDPESFRSMKKQEQTLHGLLEKLFLTTSKKGKVRWGDTTFTNTYFIPEILSVYPDASFIFLVRDGRDVVASFKAGGADAFDEYATPKVAARHWVKGLNTYDWLAKRKPVFLIRYEDMVSQPKGVLKELCSFMKIDFEPEMLDFFQHVPEHEIYALDHHQSIRKPLFRDSIGKYKDVLSAGELDELMPILRKGLNEFNYPV